MKKQVYARRDFLKKVAAGSVITGTAPLLMASCSSKSARPNLLFIFSDDHAYQAISAYGGRLASVAPTPNIDRIAHEGVLFQKCYVTNSICAPSRATVLTGKHSHLNGVLDNRMSFDSQQQTFPKLLRQTGYETAIVGKWHLKSKPTGFDYWQVLPGQGHYYNPDFKTPSGTHQETGYVTDLITDKALSWLENRNEKSKPFMLMLQHKAPHREWEPGPKHLDLFKDIKFPEPPNLFDDYQGRGTAAKKQDMSIEKTMRLAADLKVWGEEKGGAWKRTYGRMNEEQRKAWDAAYDPVIQEFKQSNLSGKELVRWKYQRYLQDYLRCIRSVDENVGRVLDYLEASGLAENTLVVYNSDQGFYLGEHGWFDKRFMYEESYKTPLVMRWPKVIDPGRIDSHLVSNLDFAQTFLDLAGKEPPADMQGRSLKPLLLGTSIDNWRKSLYYHYYEYPAVHSVRRHEGVATVRYKLIHFYDLGEWELYDLKTDPREMQNQYDNPDYVDIVAELKNELHKLRNQYKLPPLKPSKDKI
jgi:arylsulfatase A-like enzyme